MRNGIFLTYLSSTLFLLAGLMGCEPATVDKKTENKKQVEKDVHDHGHAHYHPGHYKDGHVYHTDGLDLTVGVMLNADEDRGTIVITDRPAKGESYQEQFVDVKEITVIPPKDSTTKTEFKLLADNTNEEGKASVFVMEDAKLAVVMAGHFTAKFELDGKEHSYEIFPFSH